MALDTIGLAGVFPISFPALGPGYQLRENMMMQHGVMKHIRHGALALRLAAGLLLAGGVLHAQMMPPAIVLPDSISGTMTLSAEHSYLIAGTVKVGPGAVLRIPAGTLIYGDPLAVRPVLQVERGGRIHAEGTPGKPVIFTSLRPQGEKGPGDWCGLVLLGRGDLNVPGDTAILPGTGGVYGGTDDADSSGVLSYVRIEYAGRQIASGLPSAGLLLAGTGNRTKLDHIEVAYSGGDSYRWQGGSANGRHLVALGGTEDDFQASLGYRGRLQFIFALRDSARSSATISNGFESLNDSEGSSRMPMTMPVISNMTLAGPFRADSQPAGHFGSGVHLFGNSRYAQFNSVITGWQEGIRAGGKALADAFSPACPQPAPLRLVRNAVGSQTVVWGVDSVQLFDLVFWFVCGANANPGDFPNVGLRAVTQSDLQNPDPRPIPGTPAASGTDFGDPLLAPANNFAFMATGYKGAFDPAMGRERLWDSLWTNYRPGSTTYVKHRTGWNLVSLANAPSSAVKDSIYRAAISDAFRFNGTSYQIDNTLDLGVGYWVKLGDARTVEQQGTALDLPRTVAVLPGWNLIASGASLPVAISDISASGTALESGFFGFNDGYVPVSVVEPGRAYWVKTSAAGTLRFGR